MRPKDQSEKEITRAVRSVLKGLGIFHWKAMQGLGSTPGVPDILGIYNGRLLGIEVKTRGGKVSEYQQKFIDAINQRGGIAFVVRSVDDLIAKLGVKDRFLI